MSPVPAVAAIVALVVVGCGYQGGSGPAPPTTDQPGATAGTVDADPGPAFGADDISNGLLLARGLIREADAPEGFVTRAAVRPFGESEQDRLLWCGVDLRGETGAVGGVQALLADSETQISNVITGVPDGGASEFHERFSSLGASCDATWTQPRTGLGAGVSIESEIVDQIALPELPASVSGSAFAVVLESDAGASSAVVATLVSGPFVSAVTVSGPVEADLGYAVDLVGVAADRLDALSGQFS